MPAPKHGLIVEFPGGAVRHYLLSADRVMLGRRDDCGIVLDIDTVSGNHCEIRKSPDGFRVVDLGSTNGTKRNGERVGPKGLDLQTGDSLRIGLDVRASFVKLIEVLESPIPDEPDDGGKTRRLQSPKLPAMPKINPVAAAVAKAAKGKG